MTRTSHRSCISRIPLRDVGKDATEFLVLDDGVGESLVRSRLLGVLQRFAEDRVDLLGLRLLRDGRSSGSPANSTISERIRRTCETRHQHTGERGRSASTHPKGVDRRSSWELEVP